jgi:hypothetical protein
MPIKRVHRECLDMNHPPNYRGQIAGLVAANA